MRTTLNRRPHLPFVEPLQARTLMSFSAPIATPSGGGASIDTADFNRDGRDDVVVLTGRTTAAVSLSNGDGTFRPPIPLTGGKADLVHVHDYDYNGDGRNDVVAHAYKSAGWVEVVADDTVTRRRSYTDFWSVWLGDGDGTFAAVTITSFGTSFPVSSLQKPVTTQADFDRDGIVDVARVNAGVVDVALGNSDGTYDAPQHYAAGTKPESIASGDFNGDGWIDIVVVNSLSSKRPTLSVLLNEGNQ